MGNSVDSCTVLGNHLTDLRRIVIYDDGPKKGEHLKVPFGWGKPEGTRDPYSWEMDEIAAVDTYQLNGINISYEHCMLSGAKGASLFSYRIERCAHAHNHSLQNLDIKLSQQEVAVLMRLGIDAMSQLCKQSEGAGKYMVVKDNDIIEAVARKLDDVEDSEIKRERRDEIIDALWKLKSIKDESDVKARDARNQSLVDMQKDNRWVSPLMMLGLGLVSSLISGLVTYKIFKHLQEGRKVKHAMRRYTRNLHEEALAGRLDPYILFNEGPNSIYHRMAEILGRTKKRNPLLYARAGVGKTAAVEGLQQRITDGTLDPAILEAVPTLRGAEIIEVNLADMEADNTEFRGAFEKNFKSLMDDVRKYRGGERAARAETDEARARRKFFGKLGLLMKGVSKLRKDGRNVILFIDEAHRIMSAGAAKDTPGLSEHLKPMLARGGIPFIFATTDGEVVMILRDPAMFRRTGPIPIPEPSNAETLRILDGAKVGYEAKHGVEYTPEAVRAIVENAPNIYDAEGRPLANPDRSVTVLDDLPTWLKLNYRGEKVVTAEHVLKWVAEKRAAEAADPLMKKMSEARPAEVAKPEKITSFHSIGLQIIDDFMPRESDASAKIKVDPAMAKVVTALGISPEQLPAILAGSKGVPTEAELGKMVEEKFTPERLAAWLESDGGKSWVAKNRPALTDNFRSRARIGGPALLVGIAGLLGAEEMADVMGIKDPNVRYNFIVYSMHGGKHAGASAGEIMKNRAMGRPYDFVTQRVVGTGEKAAIELSYEARTTMSRALWASLSRNFMGETAAKTALNVARGTVRLPVRTAFHMGPGLATSRIFDATVGERLFKPGSGARNATAFLAFFTPDLYRLTMGTRGAALFQKLGLRFVGRAFAAGFVLDMLALGVQSVALGDSASYQRSVEARIGERYFDAAMNDTFDEAGRMHWSYSWAGYGFGGAATALSWALNFVAPASSNMARTFDAESRYGTKFEWAIMMEDMKESQHVRDALPEQIAMTLVNGFGDQANRASFYTDVNLAMFGEEIELDGDVEDIADDIDTLMMGEEFARLDPEAQQLEMDKVTGSYSAETVESAMKYMAARNLQRSLASLSFIHLHANDDIREIVDEEGLVKEGQEDAFLKLAFPNVDPKLARTQILDMRKAVLVTMILDSEGGERTKLIELAREVGVANDAGEFVKDGIYYAALAKWSASVEPEMTTPRGALMNAHIASLYGKLLTVSDDSKRASLITELSVISKYLRQPPAAFPTLDSSADTAAVAPVIDTAHSYDFGYADRMNSLADSFDAEYEEDSVAGDAALAGGEMACLSGGMNMAVTSAMAFAPAMAM